MGESKPRLIVGLGNPESDYADTRHNLGFACARELARRFGVSVDRKRWQSLVGHSEEHGLWFVLPQTYLNLSGQAVARALKDTGLAAEFSQQSMAVRLGKYQLHPPGHGRS